jgi:hypothetical protein
VWVDARSHVVPQTILADVGERRSGVTDALREFGADVTFDVFPVGDHLVAPGILVERKSIAALHRSVAIGRLWRQLERLRATADRSWLLVEGQKLDAGQISEHGIRGAVLAVVETGIPVLWSGHRVTRRCGCSGWPPERTLLARGCCVHRAVAPDQLLCDSSARFGESRRVSQDGSWTGSARSQRSHAPRMTSSPR